MEATFSSVNVVRAPRSSKDRVELLGLLRGMGSNVRGWAVALVDCTAGQVPMVVEKMEGRRGKGSMSWGCVCE